MKALKITLITVVVVAIVALSIFWIFKRITPPSPPLQTNIFTEEINTLIDDSLSNMPAGVFCHDLYKSIHDRTNNYYRDTMFSNNVTDNERWRDNLQEKLYETYVVKFIEQANHLFARNIWDKKDRNFIAAEGSTLAASPYLEQGSEIALRLDTIDKAIKKYNEIDNFIDDCNGFAFSDYSLNADYPSMSDKINRAESYLSNMGNSYVNHCTSLKDNLRGIAETLFRKHADYINNKIALHGNTYRQYSTRSEYIREVYDPLSSQIESFASNSTYNSLSSSYKDKIVNNLNETLKRLSTESLNHFNN